MRLSEYTDDTLRVQMYCATHRDRLVTIGELPEQHGLSKNHLGATLADMAPKPRRTARVGHTA
jgi:Rrf2 family nitric oxide-sensitive transcriptional repressor